MKRSSTLFTTLYIAVVGGCGFIALIAFATLIEAVLSDQYISTDYYLSATLIFTGHVLVVIFATITRLSNVKRGDAAKSRSQTESQIKTALAAQQLSEKQARWYANGMQAFIDETSDFSQISTKARQMQVDSLISSLAKIADYYEKNEPKNTKPDTPPVFKKE